MVFTSGRLLVIRNCNIDVYPMEPLRGLANELNGTIVTVHALQTIRFRLPIWSAVLLSDNAVYDASVTEEAPVAFLARHDRTALLKYVLHHAMTDGHYSFELVYEGPYFTNTPTRWPWIANLCIGSTGRRAFWVSGLSRKNAFLLGCSLDHRHVDSPVDEYFTPSTGADTDIEEMEFAAFYNLWDVHRRHHSDAVPDGRVLWRLPGDDEQCWDVCRQLAFDDAVGIAVLGTAQGHIWILDYA